MSWEFTGDSSVGSVGSSSSVLGSVDLNVSDDQVVDIELFDLLTLTKEVLGGIWKLIYIGIGFQVLEESKEDFARFGGPSS